jgi:succinate-acetate transporter protein
MGMWMLGGFVVQVIVAVIELMKGNTTGGNVFTFFSAFFMLTTGLELIFKYFAAMNGWSMDARVDGWAWLALTASLTLWTPSYFKSAKSMLMVVLLVLPGLWIITFTDMGVWPKTLSPVAAWFLFAAGWAAIYTAAAVVLNTAFGRSVLPTGAPLIKPKPISNSKAV